MQLMSHLYTLTPVKRYSKIKGSPRMPHIVQGEDDNRQHLHLTRRPNRKDHNKALLSPSERLPNTVDERCVSESLVESRKFVGVPSADTPVNSISVELVEYCQLSTGLICLLTRIIMSVGYIPYVKSVFSARANVRKEPHMQYSLRRTL
jgi:hypothetical protein